MGTTRRALVTGGASGIGAACAGRRADGLEVVTLDLAAPADVRLDVTDEAAVERVVAGLEPVDVVVNSAGVVGPNRPLWETTRAEWEATFAVNVYGTVALCRAV